MKLIKPSYSILEQRPGLEGIYEAIERAGRTCYKSTRPEGQTTKGFVDRMIASQHYAMLEHGTVYLKVPTPYSSSSNMDFTDLMFISNNTFSGIIRKYQLNPYSKVNFDEEDKINAYITTNMRVLVENDWADDLKYLCEPTEFHEKRVTVRFTTSNSIMRELTRHRTMSFAVESTRYCNYSKDKFNNELTFIKPSWMDETSFENVQSYLNGQECNMSLGSISLVNTLNRCEAGYLSMISAGMKPQEAREILPLATKCDIIMTGFVSDWKHFFRLRSSFAETGQPHPDMKALVDPLLEEFIHKSYITSPI